MSKIILKQFGTGTIGEITQEGGSLQVMAYNMEFQGDLEALLAQFPAESLEYIHDGSSARGGEIIHKTVASTITIDDPNYLKALADQITRSKPKIAGKRVRAYVMGD